MPRFFWLIRKYKCDYASVFALWGSPTGEFSLFFRAGSDAAQIYIFSEKMIAGIWKMYHNRENAYII
jgi:hypothetical protein